MGHGLASIYCPALVALEKVVVSCLLETLIQLSGLRGHFRGELRVNHIAVALESHVGQTG